MESGFSVLKAIIKFNKFGILSSFIINKSLYWPNYVKGKDTKERFKKNTPGYFVMIPYKNNLRAWML